MYTIHVSNSINTNLKKPRDLNSYKTSAHGKHEIMKM